MNRQDIPVFVAIAAILAIVGAAVFGALDMDDTKTETTLPPAAYQHPEEEP